MGATPDDTAALAISITDANEPPTVALANTTTTMGEDTDTSVAIKVAEIVITDDAVGTNDLALSGSDAALFEIVGSELRLKVGAALDFETNPTLDVTVEVDDTTVGATPDDTAALAISITDVNDNAPVIPAGQSFSVAEDAANGASVGTVTAGDVDTVGSLQGWTITDGNTDGIFAIDGATGEITIADNTNLDFETTTSYTLTLTVSDGVNTSAPQTVTIDITDVSEFSVGAVTDSDASANSVSESAANGTVVCVTVNVSDVNDAPTAGADAYTVDADQSLNVPADGVLDNDTS